MANAQKIAAVPALADLLNDPEEISALPKDVIAELRGQIATLVVYGPRESSPSESLLVPKSPDVPHAAETTRPTGAGLGVQETST